MEVSTPTRIIEGNSTILGVTTGVIPGSGECAIISSSSAINVYSIAEKNIIATWTFPSNQKQCIVSPAYITNEHGYSLNNYYNYKWISFLSRWENVIAMEEQFPICKVIC